jgi:hypothetical protein
MIKKRYIFNLMIYYAVFYLVILCGCNSKPQTSTKVSSPGKINNNTTKKDYAHDPAMNISNAPEYSGLYNRLEFNKFQSLRNSNDEFSTISIDYRELSDFDQYGEARLLKDLMIDTGFASVSQYMNAVSTYEVFLRIDSDQPYSVSNGEHSGSCDPELVNDIFNYIADPDNRSYFFNGDEFTGLQQPYHSRYTHINDGNYIFVIAFGEPNESGREWAISKSTDQPDEIWQGLIDIIDENFVGMFD